MKKIALLITIFALIIPSFGEAKINSRIPIISFSVSGKYITDFFTYSIKVNDGIEEGDKITIFFPSITISKQSCLSPFNISLNDVQIDFKNYSYFNSDHEFDESGTGFIIKSPVTADSYVLTFDGSGKKGDTIRFVPSRGYGLYKIYFKFNWWNRTHLYKVYNYNIQYSLKLSSYKTGETAEYSFAISKPLSGYLLFDENYGNKKIRFTKSIKFKMKNSSVPGKHKVILYLEDDLEREIEFVLKEK